MCIPEATENLISVRHAATRGVDFKFLADRCEISSNSSYVATAPSIGDSIYYLNGYSPQLPDSGSQAALVTHTKESPRLWHNRFGHLGYDNLARLPSMVTGIGVTAEEFKAAAEGGDGLCKPCALGKQHRAPFKPSSSKAQLLGMLLHRSAGACATTA